MFNIWCESLLALKAQGLLLLAAVFCSVAVCGAVLEAPHLQPAVCSAQELEEARGNSGTVGAIDSPLCDAAWNAQLWSWDLATSTSTVCTSDDEIERKHKDTFFIFVQMNPHAVCKLRGSSVSNLTSTGTSALPGCKSIYEKIPLDWTIDHFFPWHGKYGLSLTTVRPCTGPFIPCPIACDYSVNSVISVNCTSFDAGDHKDELTKYWLDPIYSTQQHRWSSEWSHVQPCFQLAQDIQNNGTNPSVKFASEILKLYTSHNITASLAQHNITPSDTKPPYPLKDIENAFSSKVILGCRLSDSECVLTRIGFCFNYTKSLEPIVIDCPDLYPDHKERPLPWILLDYSFKTYTEDGFVCNSSCTNVRYYGYGHD